MASDDNKFRKTEGGAAMTPSLNSKNSIDATRMHHNELPINNKKPIAGEEPAIGSEPNNELENQEEQNPEKELMKQGAKKALKAAKVPGAVADKLVDKAAEDGTIEKVVDKYKKAKKAKRIAAIIGAIFSAIASALPYILIIIIIIVVIVGIIVLILGPILSFINFIASFFKASATDPLIEIEKKMPNSCYLATTMDIDFSNNYDELYDEFKLGKNSDDLIKIEDEVYAKGVITSNLETFSKLRAAAIAPITSMYFFDEIEEIEAEKDEPINSVRQDIQDGYASYSIEDLAKLIYAGLARNDENGNKVSYYLERIKDGSDTEYTQQEVYSELNTFFKNNGKEWYLDFLDGYPDGNYVDHSYFAWVNYSNEQLSRELKSAPGNSGKKQCEYYNKVENCVEVIEYLNLSLKKYYSNMDSDSQRLSIVLSYLINYKGYYFDQELYSEFLKNYYIDYYVSAETCSEDSRNKKDGVEVPSCQKSYIYNKGTTDEKTIIYYKSFTKLLSEELDDIEDNTYDTGNGTPEVREQARASLTDTILSNFELLSEQYISEYSYDRVVSNILNRYNVAYCPSVGDLDSDYSIILDELRAEKESLEEGSGDEITIVDTLGPLYGESSCTLLSSYNPLTHEYVESISDNGEIHSVSDGEVVSIYNGVNLYDKYDSKTKKCLCNGVECDNYNGSEIKIKFKYDDLEYMAIYSNLGEIKVNVGDIVSKGDIIALEGDTGCTSKKKTSFKLISENGISYNTDELIQRCSTTSSTMNNCDFANIEVNLLNSDDEIINNMNFYDYIKDELYNNFKTGLDNKEFMKAASIMLVTKVLRDNGYEVGNNEINIKSYNYKENNISSENNLILDSIIEETKNQVLLYGNRFANIRYSNCTRTEKDSNANSVYNELCTGEALKLNKNYDEILKIYYPNYYLSKNYCYDYAKNINRYSLDNNKGYLSIELTDENILKINTNLKNRVEIVKYASRAGVVEAARFLTLGFDYKIPYKNGGKYFEIGFNKDWYIDGIDSSGFVSWALLNGGVKLEKSLTIKEIINNNVSGSLKITSELYKNFDNIQVGDFAYKDNKIGIIIGKDKGVLYVAEADINKGLTVSTITSYGETESGYTHIYFSDYYLESGNVTNMW